MGYSVLGGLGDKRRDDRADRLFEAVMATGSLVLRKLADNRAELVAFHRLLNASCLSVGAMMATVSARTAASCSGRRIVAAQDTTEIAFRPGGGSGDLGPGSNGVSPAFFAHPVIAIDVETEAVLGLVAADLWTRAKDPVTPHASRPFAERESVRWHEGADAANHCLSAAASVVVVADRESDIYEYFAAARPGCDLIVRSRHKRQLVDGIRLDEAVTGLALYGTLEVAVPPRGPGFSARLATVRLRAGPVTIARPAHCKGIVPEQMALHVVDASEENAPVGQPPLHWRLLTTLPAGSATQAAEIIGLYRLRWRIEEVFRALKSAGLELDQTQARRPDRLFKIATIGLIAAVRTMQLVGARDGSPRPASDVMDKALLPIAAAIGKTLEGKTERQKNHHPEGSLAWIAWIAARLGGWHCYYKPPGPKTMNDGWTKLAAMIAGYTLAQVKEIV
jgi:hypothetical protein